MSFDVYLNVAVGGILTGLIYGLMALGLSVVFGVVRVVNFAHGEMMTIAMYLAVVLFAQFHLDPLVMLVPIAAVLFVCGYALQAGLINPFITRPEHSQFLLLVALGLIIGGAVGNAIDRFAYGAVLDFALFHLRIGGKPFNWYVFNLADVAIVAGVAALLYDSFLGVPAAKAP